MAIREYAGLLCDETPWQGTRFVYDAEDHRWKPRRFEARLQVTPKTMIAYMDTPAGVPMLWQHGYIGPTGMVWGMAPAIGRVRKMGFSGKALMGEVAISENALLPMSPGGLDDVEAGINSGFSVGLTFLDNPAMRWEMREGTREKPDLLIVGAVRVTENSLTPMPRLQNAGIHETLVGAADEGDDMAAGEADEALSLAVPTQAAAAAALPDKQLAGGPDLVLDGRVPMFTKTGEAKAIAAETRWLTAFRLPR